MRYMPYPQPHEFDERFFPMAFISRCPGEDGCCNSQVLIRIFDPNTDDWRVITLDQWRFVLATARSLQ